LSCFSFPGNRWARSKGDKDIVIITDVNGFIAGEQSVVMKDKTEEDKYFNFECNPYYTLDDFFGEEAYFVTAYFVNTSIICDGGRTEDEFKAQGTGDRVSFQNGPTAHDLEHIPLTQEAMDKEVRSYANMSIQMLVRCNILSIAGRLVQAPLLCQHGSALLQLPAKC
jgi:hypothetical protein